MVFVDVSDINWIVAEGKCLRLHTATGSHRLRVPIGGPEERLGPRRFIRIHRSAIVSIRRVKEMFRGVGDDFVVILCDSTQ